MTAGDRYGRPPRDYAPFLSAISQIRCRLTSGAAVDAALSDLDLDARVVKEGANFAVIEASTSGELFFREHLAGVWLASPIQVYLDLLRGEGRAKEMSRTYVSGNGSDSDGQARHPKLSWAGERKPNTAP